MNSKAKKGFSLIELSIVVLIVSIFASSAVNILGRKNMADKYAETKEKLIRIAEAIKIFTKDSGAAYIPCPVTYSIEADNPWFGVARTEKAGDNCTTDSLSYDSSTGAVGGGVPFLTISLPPEYAFDAWGNRIAYITDTSLTAAGGDVAHYGGAQSTDITSSSNIQIDLLLYNSVAGNQETISERNLLLKRNPKRSELGGSVYFRISGFTSVAVGSQAVPQFYASIGEAAAFILISYGPNGYRATKINGEQINSNVSGTSGYGEIANCPGPQEVCTFDNIYANSGIKTDTRFVTTTSYFDDIVLHKTKNWLDN